jgi:hypothetical protein
VLSFNIDIDRDYWEKVPIYLVRCINQQTINTQFNVVNAESGSTNTIATIRKILGDYHIILATTGNEDKH